MTPLALDDSQERVLVVAPLGRDAELTCELLSGAGLSCEACGDVDALSREIANGAGCAIVTEEALGPEAVERLKAVMDSQPPWSDFPIILFSRAEAFGDLSETNLRLSAIANVTLLDRPIRQVILLTTVRASLRARRRQYEVRNLFEQLEHSVHQRDQFLAMLGHELRNPLGAILTSTQLMEKKNVRIFRRERSIILRQSRLLTRLVDDLLDVARVTSGKVTLQKSAVDLNELAERCFLPLRAAAKTHRVGMTLTPSSELVVVDGDPARLEQVLTNLLTNAMKYTPQGGRVDVLLAREEERAVIRVSDTGVGIPPEFLGDIFELFTQAESSLDRSQGGMGIGLTLVKTLVELHGGSVGAQSAGLGQGSTFTVSLPIRSGDATSRDPRPFRRKDASSRHIVLIEDNADLREPLETLLRESGHHVETACDGYLGVEKVLSARPEIALVDIGLPGLDGYEVARRLRAAMGAGTFLVALTGYGQPEDRLSAFEAGFDAHLTKPIDLDELERLLTRRASGEKKGARPAPTSSR